MSIVQLKSMLAFNPTRQGYTSTGRILLLLSASAGVSMTGMGIIWPLLPIYAAELGAGGLQVGLIIASFNMGRTLSGPFMGRLSDHWGRKPFIATGLFLYALLSILYIQVDSVGSMIAVRLIHGLAAVMVTPVAMAMIADTAPANKLGHHMGTLSMALMLGLGIGPMLGGLIQDHFGRPAAFYSMGVLALINFFAIAALLPGRSDIERQVGPKPVASLHTLLGQRMIQVLFILRLFTSSGQGCVYTFLPLLAVQMHITSSQVGLVLGTNIYLIAFLQRYCGKLADRTNPVPLLLGGTLLSGLAVLAMPLSTGFPLLLTLNIVMGAGTGITSAGGFVLAGRLGRTLGQGSVMGVTDAGWSMGMIASPVLSGLIMDHWGMSAIFYVGGTLIVAGTGLSALMLKGMDPQESSGFGPADAGGQPRPD